MKRPAHLRSTPHPAAMSAAAWMLVTLGCGGDGSGTRAVGDGVSGPGAPAPEAPVSRGEPAPAPLAPGERGREALEAALQETPSDLAMELDPSLIQTGDPAAFPAAVTVGGQPVRILREHHPDTGGLLRIYAALVGREGDGGRPILHGPEWSFFETGGQSALSWWKEGVLHGPVKQSRKYIYQANFELIPTFALESAPCQAKFIEGDRSSPLILSTATLK